MLKLYHKIMMEIYLAFDNMYWNKRHRVIERMAKNNYTYTVDMKNKVTHYEKLAREYSELAKIEYETFVK